MNVIEFDRNMTPAVDQYWSFPYYTIKKMKNGRPKADVTGYD